MFEVLFPSEVFLPASLCVSTFNKKDHDAATEILERLNVNWTVSQEAPSGDYPTGTGYFEERQQFIETALNDENWTGNGLDFDRLRK
ncbi:MAG: hypothetical protein ABJU19_20025 [Roseobacter sp.]